MKTRLLTHFALIAGMVVAVVVGPRDASATKTRLGTPVSFACGNVTEIPQDECDALAELCNNSTYGPGWLDGSDWLVYNTPYSWYGMVCTGTNATSLVLSFNQLSGSIPPEMGKLAT